MIANIIKPTIIGANILIRNTTIAIIIINIIIPIIMAPILPNAPISSSTGIAVYEYHAISFPDCVRCVFALQSINLLLLL